jgi:hypothetical protein
MSDVYMHCRLTEDLIRWRNEDIIPEIANLGAQFSDPMYYATLHKHAKRYRQYADRMHDTDTQTLMIHMINYVKAHPSKIAYSFLFGWISHYALDVKMHPYVYHHVGVYKKDDPKTHPWRGLHLKFERSIDAVLFEQEQKRAARKIRLTTDFFTTARVPNEIAELMKDTFYHQFGVEDGDVVYRNSVRYMYRILKYIAQDRFGIKKQIYKIVDAFHKKHDLFMADLSFFNHIEDYDFLNENKRTWHHPVTNEASTKTVKELYQEALIFADNLLSQVDDYIAGMKIDLKTIFTNLSLNSGVECSQSFPFQHFHIYRPKNND